MPVETEIRAKYLMLQATLNERTRRLWAGAEAKILGKHGIVIASRATGLAYNTVQRGFRECEEKNPLDPERVRRPGGGRKRATQLQPELPAAVELLVEPLTRGDPESPLRWTCKSTRNLSEELRRHGYRVSHTVVAHILHELDYSLQANRKSKEGADHPDRNAQFEHINAAVRRQLARGEPAISVDTKKKELVGEYRNNGREWRPEGQPEEVKTHDFIDPERGKAIPYGVYDVARNIGWVSVGVDHDTATFAVATIRRWWREMGRKSYPNARSLLIMADNGGSNGARVRLWKWELQRFADHTGMTISVCHFPPGTSKWNKIEHRLFAFITKNWRGKPLMTHAVIVALIASTRTRTGLIVRCALDMTSYPKEVKPTAKQMASIVLVPDTFHGDWNYSIHPHRGR